MVPSDTMQVRSTLTAATKSFDYYSPPKGKRAARRLTAAVLAEGPAGKPAPLEDETRDHRRYQGLAKWLDNKGGASKSPTARRGAAAGLCRRAGGRPCHSEAVVELGADPKKINPISLVGLVIDHSVMVDHFGDPIRRQEHRTSSATRSATSSCAGASLLENFRVVPPDRYLSPGNLEYLAKTVWTAEVDGSTIAYPDTLVGTDRTPPWSTASRCWAGVSAGSPKRHARPAGIDARA